MQTELVAIRDQQRETWNRFSPGWKKWDDFTMNFLKPMGDAIIAALHIQSTDHVLDVACGTGEPGLTIAGLATEGKVTGTDLADQMLGIARENAKFKQLSNYETQTCDVCELPFSNDSFDKVSCRMGFMFFPDMQMASDEMYRVLKTGGSVSASVWSTPAKNGWIANIMSVISRNLLTPPPAPAAPGMFRCAAPGMIKLMMEKSGFKNVSESEVAGKVLYQNFDFMWQMMNEVAAPVVAALSKADSALQQKIKSEVEQVSQEYQTSKGLELTYGAWIITAHK